MSDRSTRSACNIEKVKALSRQLAQFEQRFETLRLHFVTAMPFSASSKVSSSMYLPSFYFPCRRRDSNRVKDELILELREQLDELQLQLERETNQNVSASTVCLLRPNHLYLFN